MGAGIGLGLGLGLGLGTGLGVGSGWTWRFRSSWERVLSVATSLSTKGDSGESGLGLLMAVSRSLAAAMIMSLLEAMGMVTCLGNQETVSTMRVARVSLIQIL